MGKRIIPYPTIRTTQALSKLAVENEWHLYHNGKELSLQIVKGYAYRITDKDWFPDTGDLHVEFTCKLRNPVKLFSGSHDSKGCEVANRKSILGVAVRWMLPKTNLQGAIHCKDVSVTKSGELSFRCCLDFPQSTIRYRLTLEAVVYLKTPFVVDTELFAKTSGTLLGTLSCFTLITGGSGGYFPIETEENPNGPLWRIYCNVNSYDDFQEDFEEERFCLILNRAHPLYEKVGISSREGKLIVTPLMFEIFINACFVLFSRACKYMDSASWILTKAEKDSQTVFVNFKALKVSCMNEYDKKQILDMQPEELMLLLRDGLSKKMFVEEIEEPKS